MTGIVGCIAATLIVSGGQGVGESALQLKGQWKLDRSSLKAHTLGFGAFENEGGWRYVQIEDFDFDPKRTVAATMSGMNPPENGKPGQTASDRVAIGTYLIKGRSVAIRISGWHPLKAALSSDGTTMTIDHMVWKKAS